MGKNEAARGGALVLTWLEDNYDTIRKFFGDTFVTNAKQMVRGFPEEAATEAEYQRLKACLDRHGAELGSTVDTVQQGLDKMAANIKWRNRFLAQVQDWLAKESAVVEGERREEEEEERGDLWGNLDVGLLCPIDLLGLFCN